MDDNINDYIWQSLLDEKYHWSVTRTSERTGILKIINQDNNEQLLSQEVNLSYGAIFGPDIADIMNWENAVMRVVDNIK